MGSARHQASRAWEREGKRQRKRTGRRGAERGTYAHHRAVVIVDEEGQGVALVGKGETQHVHLSARKTLLAQKLGHPAGVSAQLRDASGRREWRRRLALRQRRAAARAGPSAAARLVVQDGEKGYAPRWHRR